MSTKSTDDISILKNEISEIIQSGDLEKAKVKLKSLSKLCPEDIDIFSMESVVAIAEGRLEDAETLLLKGIKLSPKNVDMLYNLAYIYGLKQKYDLALEYYEKTYECTSDTSLKKEIKDNIKALKKPTNEKKKEPSKKVLIGSPVHQKPEILKEFLLSLQELKKDNIDVHYLFIDDNAVQESSDILNSFSAKEKNVTIYKSDANDEFLCNGHTHHWNERLVWKVANFKDRIIKIALDFKFDYLFLIDSDLVLHPNTLLNLIDTGKDIVSNIFWTKWQEHFPELPQVWLMDHYTQFEFGRNEQLSQNEIQIRHKKFIDTMRRAGLYEVGGLGACTIITRKALEMGVCFKEIKNVSFWGEDRHFCIRAAALGIPMFVDTHYPAYHIYRETDLGGVAEYKEENKYVEDKLKEESTRAPFARMAKEHDNKLTLSMIVKNESNRYLERALKMHRQYIDNAVIIDDGSTDNTVEICREVLKGIPTKIIVNPKSKFHNEVELRKQQWEETIKTNPDWILNLDADEMFEDRFVQDVRLIINQQEFDVIQFRLYDFWDEEHYRDDQYWFAHNTYREFLVRYQKNFNYIWKETKQHCGRFPANIGELPKATCSLRLRHFGWAKPEDRLAKYERYMKLDPGARFGWKEQYDSILDKNPNLIKWIG